MRKLLTVIVYTILVLLIGRNLSSLPRFTVLSNPQHYATELQAQTKKIIAGKKGSYGIYYADLTTGQHFGINEHQMFTAASVNKVPIIAVLYYLENKGKLNFDEQITLQQSDIQDYGTGSLRYAKLGTTYSLKSLAKLSLQQSDNTAAHILGERIGMDVIQHTINDWGLTQTDMANNQTSPQDMELLFQKIYTNHITTPAKTQELLQLMTNTDIEDRLPSELPAGTTVYHKTGDAIGSLNDVGIIKRNKHVFFLGVLTSDIGSDEATAKKTIADIAKNTVAFYDAHD
jgi:beta-lactamase class A